MTLPNESSHSVLDRESPKGPADCEFEREQIVHMRRKSGLVKLRRGA
ncbi:hypothetical protein [Litoreibacter roseus]|nr:hypothetical protein [Litoreibacter roseus]